MRAGNLISRINFYAKVITRDAYGASVDTWPAVTIATRGEVRWVGGSRTLENEEKTYTRSMELTVRYRNEITETMHVQIDNGTETYIITYLEIIGRNEALRLTLEKINNEMLPIGANIITEDELEIITEDSYFVITD
jgi:head-tail adaptor